MPVQLIYRKEHTRRLKSGDTVRVAASWILRESASKSHRVNQFTHLCPKCGAKVRSVRMPNGGWAHFEAAGGLESLKHPCFDIGADIALSKDPNTPDLFEHL